MFEPTEIERLTAEELLLLQRNFEALLRRHAGLIHHVCVRRSKGDAELCKLLQHEVSVGLWLHLDSYRGGKAEPAWVYWRARKIISDYFQQRIAPPEQLSLEIADTLAEEVFHAREQLEEIMAYLTPEENQLLEMQMEEAGVKEMSLRLQCTSNAVYKRLKQVMKKAKIINEKINKR